MLFLYIVGLYIYIYMLKYTPRGGSKGLFLFLFWVVAKKKVYVHFTVTLNLLNLV